MNDFIKGLVLLLLTYVVSVIVGAYFGYFIGMIVSLTAGGLFSFDGLVIAEIFSWIGISLANIFYVLILVDHYNRTMQREEIEIETDLFDEIMKEIDNE